LEPGSQQLLVGGIGSGKTTELLLAERWLREQEHVLPLYIDVSAETDLSSLNSGSLLASFGMHLAWRLYEDFHVRTEENERTKKLKEIYEKVDGYAYGKRVTRFVGPPEGQITQDAMRAAVASAARFFVSEKVPGKLK